MKDKPRFKSPEARNLMVLVLALDPTMKDCLRKMLRMGVRNIRHDYMYVRNAEGGYDYLPDPTAWMGDISPNVGIMMLRGSSGVDRNDPGAEWWLNGF